MATGKAVAHFVGGGDRKQVVIGRDTRGSGSMLESALAAGIASQGVDVCLAGVIPTPAVAFLAMNTPDAGAGIVISASHNPYYDNGIKLFRGDGHKLSDEEEAMMEARILALLSNNKGDNAQEDRSGEEIANPGHIQPMSHVLERYATFLRGIYTQGIKDTHAATSNDSPLGTIVVDCSNGAAFQVAQQVFAPPHFNARFIHISPDGVNINKDCGSQHTEDLSKEVIKHNACAGLAFDGDADRLIALDETGAVVTGDKILAICAAHAARKGHLTHNRVVSTVMSNIGLSRALKSLGIHHEITGVGDRQVMAAMEKSGAVLGGEDSGHMIFSNCLTTGDGLLTALKLLIVMVETGEALSRLAEVMTVYPQVLKNVSVRPDKPDFMGIDAIASSIEQAEKLLNGNGRVLVRYSGTQPLLRVMVEGEDSSCIHGVCDEICRVIREYIGL
ncbi:phosphoglucosamine mutase [Desulfocicer vacuolatum DSM 3385]|uniref:Phosphoglucosamine mutase n=2 Tax=Desulfocicer vacuolatum TaxID=2298 RepID=A0A1W1Z6Z1_9BACT|nr:phosphoglucosamine mutase [Desulfocicer vacuolatum DSM 3385]